MGKYYRYVVSFGSFVIAASSLFAENLAFVGKTDKDPLSYDIWEKMTFTVTLVDKDKGNAPVKGRKLKWSLKGDDGTDESGEASSDEPLVKKAFQTKPGFVRLTVNVLDDAGKIVGGNSAKFDGGAGAAVNKIETCAMPDDFQCFWDDKTAELRSQPCAVQVEPIACTNDAVVFQRFSIKMSDTLPPSQGLVAYPKKAAERSLPISIEVAGYGFGRTSLNPLDSLKDGGKILMHITRHGEHPMMDDGYYENIKTNVCRNFCFRNNEHAETSDLFKMLMRDLKALQWAKTLPQWNGRDIATHGGSMGGYRALGLAALDQDVTSVWAFIPWCADLAGHAKYKRMQGWLPNWTPALGYLHLVNLATRVRCPVSMVIGLGDYICPPSGEMILFRNLNCQKNLEVVQNMGHGARYGVENATTHYTDFEIKREFCVEMLDYHHESLSKKHPHTGWRLIDGNERWYGLIAYAPSKVSVRVGKDARSVRFRPSVTDHDANKKHYGESVKLTVSVNGKVLREGFVKHGERRDYWNINLPGSETVEFSVEAPEGMQISWDDLAFSLPAGKYPCDHVRNHSRQLGILTPRASATPRINGPKVFGVRPGHPIIYRVPITGLQPLAIDAVGLPEGVKFESKTHVLSGSVAKAGDYRIIFKASNRFGSCERDFTLKIGEKIALTPPLGFNSWNAFSSHVTQRHIEKAADAMVRLGLADHGWSYVVVDDFWQNNPKSTDKTLGGPERKADGSIQPNVRFPSMKAMADHIHAYGLKAGLYSSPGPYTCGGCVGSWGHEVQDAQSYAAWGYDFLKYDWCSYGKVATGKGRERAIKPYRLMGEALMAQNRDILFSLCQYGMENVSSWGESVHGQAWRTTGDVFDIWAETSCAITPVPMSIERQKKIWKHVHPGAWNDPDMMCVGRMQWNNHLGSRLAPNELYTHVTMWALVAAPMMIGCDMERMDDFTYSLLTNDEVLEINQDELGAAATCVDEDKSNGWEVWARPMVDGSIAAGLYNRAVKEQPVKMNLSALGMAGKWRVRDVWRQQDGGEVAKELQVSVPGHATHFVRLWPLDEAARQSAKSDIRKNAK